MAVGAAVAATDDDSDSLTYSLTGADASSFNVDSDGQIKVGTGTSLDYEAAKNDYTVIVQVHDGKNPSGGVDTAIDDTIVVTINVTDVNEMPEFDSATATRSIAENSLENATVGAPVTATDPDTSDTSYLFIERRGRKLIHHRQSGPNQGWHLTHARP